MALIHVDPKLIASIGATYVLVHDRGESSRNDAPSFGQSLARLSKIQYTILGKDSQEGINPLPISWSEILPEVACERIIEALFAKAENPKEFVKRCREQDVIPGSLVFIFGTINFIEGTKTEKENSISIEALKYTNFHGENCILGRIQDNPYFLPVYFHENASSVLYCQNQIAKVLGVSKWTPWFQPGSGSPVSIAIRVAAVWID